MKITTCFLAIFLALVVSITHAVEVTWTGVQEIVSNQDIRNPDSVIAAYNFGGLATDVKVGGKTVSFTPAFKPFDKTDNRSNEFFDSTGTEVGADFESVLDTVAYSQFPTTSEKMTFTGLSSGSTCLLQVFASDDRSQRYGNWIMQLEIGGKTQKIEFGKSMKSQFVNAMITLGDNETGFDLIFKGVGDQGVMQPNALVLSYGTISGPTLFSKKNADGVIAYWKFDDLNNKNVVETVSGISGTKSGYLEDVTGVKGRAMKGDGFTTRISYHSYEALDINKGFSVEAWIAPQEYSWNWTGLVDQENGHNSGFSFGIDYIGRIGLYAAIDGKWQGLVSQESVPLLKWSHIAATFDPANGIAVYINGQPAGKKAIKGKATPSKADLWIGMSHTKQWPALTERNISKTPTQMVFDGLIDEVKLYSGQLDPKTVMKAFKAVVLNNAQPLQYRVMPSGPKGPGAFGAYYTHLQYCPEWDRLWRVSDHPDVIVRFDESPTKVVFWRGTGYCPAWVSENDRWVSDQGPEIFKNMCFEHMSDKQCRYSQVRIIENTPARVLVHWRTALPNAKYEFTNVDPKTGWGPWADDYYYIYPDGVCVRYQRAWGPNIHEFLQSELLCQPGTKPQDNIEMDAITIMDLQGNTNTFSWEKAYGKRLPAKKAVNGPIQIKNLKSKNRHYVIGETGSTWRPFTFGARKGYSTMPNWNHWPVAQLPNDGRVAPAPDRPSSSCLGTLFPIRHEGQGIQQWVRNLYGMTDKDPKHLAVLGRSWNNPAKLKLHGQSFTSQGYDKNQRAYVLSYTGKGKPAPLTFSLQASKKSPVVNPAFVIKNWGDSNAVLKLDGKEIKRGKIFRFGHGHTLEGTDLIVWLKTESTKAIAFSIFPSD